MTEPKDIRMLRGTPENMWSHTIKGTISKIDTKANTISLIRDGCRDISDLERVENDLRHISDELRSQVTELFTELDRLQKACNQVKK